MNTEPMISKRKIVLCVAVLLMALLTYVLSSYSFIEINVSNHSNGTDLTYSLTGSQENIAVSSNASYKKLVSKGSYEITVKQGDKNYLALVDTGGFLKTTRIEAVLQQESDRTFVGDNPLACMDYAGVLVSYNCEGSVASMQVHSPATQRVASTVRKVNSDSVFGSVIESTLIINERLHILGITEVDGDIGAGLFPLVNDGRTISYDRGTTLSNLTRPGARYGISDYKNGFIIFKENDAIALAYESLGDQNPKEVPLPTKPMPADMRLHHLSTRGEDIISVFTTSINNELSGASFMASNPKINNEEVIEDEVVEAVDESQGKSSIIISGARDKQVDFEFSFNQARLCSPQHICLVKNTVMDVYDISETKPRLVNKMNDVLQIETFGERLLIVNAEGVISYDAQSGAGHFQYRFGDYIFCGLKVSRQQYLLCVDNPNNKTRQRQVLLVDPETPKDDDIDKQLFELSKLDAISLLAPYENFIHISGNYGEVMYNQESDEFGYSPQVISSVNRAIDEKIKESGIDTSKYKFINPFNPEL